MIRDEAAFCATCLAPHHADCFADHGHCAAPGCAERATVRAGVRPPGRRWSRWALGFGVAALLPVAALAGAGLLTLADVFARTVAAPAELPLGVVTAAVGAPMMLWLLLRRRRDLVG
ncbi:MAG: iron chelate uptake ABC transporter family permease subunit [Planctomycetes bacterium]|nr:iron chelate uptake ABC transporter family permease subunit [Planctomycetota bacterium]